MRWAIAIPSLFFSSAGTLPAAAPFTVNTMPEATLKVLVGYTEIGDIMAADGGEIPPKPTVAPMPFLKGGGVPGRAPVDGDSPQNDVVNAKLSPGEVVLPRTVAQNPGPRGANINRFLAAKVPQVAAKMAPHPSDIASVMRALSELRGQA